MTTDEQKLEAIKKCFTEYAKEENNDEHFITDGYAAHDEIPKKILNSLKQFGPAHLEVDFQKLMGNLYRLSIPKWFRTEQEAIDFCAKHGLRVKK